MEKPMDIYEGKTRVVKFWHLSKFAIGTVEKYNEEIDLKNPIYLLSDKIFGDQEIQEK